MKITKIKAQKKCKNRYNIYAEGQFLVGLSEATIADNLIYVGKEINEVELNNLTENDEFYKCLNKAFDYLSRRLHSEKELKDKLNQRFDYQTISRVIARLKSLKYIDDEKFAKAWVECRCKSRGSSVLRLELARKGVNKEIVQSILETDYLTKEDEISAAERLISKSKYMNMSKEELYNKAGSLLSRRGYNYEVIKKVIDKQIKKPLD